MRTKDISRELLRAANFLGPLTMGRSIISCAARGSSPTFKGLAHGFGLLCEMASRLSALDANNGFNVLNVEHGRANVSLTHINRSLWPRGSATFLNMRATALVRGHMEGARLVTVFWSHMFSRLAFGYVRLLMIMIYVKTLITLMSSQ